MNCLRSIYKPGTADHRFCRQTRYCWPPVLSSNQVLLTAGVVFTIIEMLNMYHTKCSSVTVLSLRWGLFHASETASVCVIFLHDSVCPIVATNCGHKHFNRLQDHFFFEFLVRYFWLTFFHLTKRDLQYFFNMQKSWWRNVDSRFWNIFHKYRDFRKKYFARSAYWWQ